MSVLVSDILTMALIEADWLAQGETAQAQDAEFARKRANLILDEWSAREPFAWAEEFNLYTLIPALSPHTIGPTGTFVTTQRPVRIQSAAIVLTNSDGTTTDVPIPVEDAEWWASIRVKDIQSSISNGVYYEPDVPNGKLFFWPVPSFAYGVRLQTWSLISQFSSITQRVDLAPGYQNALTMTLAQRLAGPRSMDPILMQQVKEGQAAITGNNAPSPRMCTAQAGMGSTGKRPDFNFLDGTPWG